MTTYGDNVLMFLALVSWWAAALAAVACIMSGRWYLVIPGAAFILWWVTR